MQLQINQAYLGFYEALASKTRLEVIQSLSERDMNIKELAAKLGVSCSIMTRHVRKLEGAGIIATRTVKKGGARQKTCTLLNTNYELVLPPRQNNFRQFYQTSLPVGQFTDIKAAPPCGIANEYTVIGGVDEPAFLWKPERVNANLIWFAEGAVEYKVPNYVPDVRLIDELEISAELSSEATGYCEDWPSDIAMSINGRTICTVTTPGDFGETRGTLTPEWWHSNQYGLLYIVRADWQGVYVNGVRVSELRLDELNLNSDHWILKFEVKKERKNPGGLTIFGRKFGNYPQDIIIRTFYSTKND